jgi:hypothetical protein
MKHFLALLSIFGVALAASSPSTVHPGVFYARAGSEAKLRFEFKFEPNLLFNRAGESTLTLNDPWTKKPLEFVVEKGTPDKTSPDEYHSSLEPIASTIKIPKDAKPGAYPVKLESETFLCDNNTKVCYIERLQGTLEIRVGSGKDAPVVLEFKRAKPR